MGDKMGKKRTTLFLFTTEAAKDEYFKKFQSSDGGERRIFATVSDLVGAAGEFKEHIDRILVVDMLIDSPTAVKDFISFLEKHNEDGVMTWD